MAPYVRRGAIAQSPSLATAFVAFVWDVLDAVVAFARTLVDRAYVERYASARANVSEARARANARQGGNGANARAFANVRTIDHDARSAQ